MQVEAEVHSKMISPLHVNLNMSVDINETLSLVCTQLLIPWPNYYSYTGYKNSVNLPRIETVL